MYCDYWNTVWKLSDLEEYRTYLSGFYKLQNNIIKTFKDHHVKTICDVACGFGSFALALSSNGFDVYGCDISEEAVLLTTQLLAEYGIDAGRFQVENLLHTSYSSTIIQTRNLQIV